MIGSKRKILTSDTDAEQLLVVTAELLKDDYFF